MATSFSAEQRKIQRQIDRLVKQQELLLRKERGPVIAKIVQQMREFNISPEELAQNYSKGAGKRNSKAAAPSSASSKARTKAPVLPRYKNPETGESWTGRGRPPRWMVDAEAEGWSRDDFLIVQAGTEATSSSGDSTAVNNGEGAVASTQPTEASEHSVNADAGDSMAASVDSGQASSAQAQSNDDPRSFGN